KNEGKLICNLRCNDDFISELSLVAEIDDSIVGHILFFPLRIISENSIHKCLSLAPMAVTPDYQNKGIGSKLVRAGLDKAKSLGFNSCVVLGHPKYYPRFGFKHASKWGIKAPVEVPDEAFMAAELISDSLSKVSGVVEFPKEYYDAM
ncbi:MAG: GNAT family N-acetyltransferase, partial [Ignavibacteria bacterium RBG_13_36_8]